LFEPAISEAQSCIKKGLLQQPEVLFAQKSCSWSTNTTLKDSHSYLCVAQCSPILVFMSDGVPSSSEDNGEDKMRALHEEISRLTSELQVKTLAFGENADCTKLEALAHAGDGEFLLAVDGLELKACFEKAAASLVKTHFR
jgi:hypothetical protein